MKGLGILGLLICLGYPVRAGEAAAIFVFGPEGAETLRETSREAAEAGRRWAEAGYRVEVRQAGVPDGIVLDRKATGRAAESLFFAAARGARDADPGSFISALGVAVQALAGVAGERRLVGVLECPPLSGEGVKSLAQVVESAREAGVRLILLDGASKEVTAVWKNLVQGPAAAIVRSGRGLEAAMQRPAVAGGEAGSAPAPSVLELPQDLPVNIRFVRTSASRSSSWGTQRSFSGSGGPSGGGITTREGGPNAEAATGVLRGLLVVETPLKSFQFEVNEAAKTYQAKAVVTQVVRDRRGRPVWQARKNVIIRGPLSRLENRMQGSLYYLRELQLPAGQYTLEGVVEDETASKAGGIRKPLVTGAGLPGFNVSDALFVRKFDGSADKFEADQVLSYDGEAISPLLAPVFRAEKPFDLQLYFVLYPDINGAQPEVRLEVLRNGTPVGRVPLPFTDSLRDTTRDGIGAMRGEQKSQFPYLAVLRGMKLSSGNYEARITVQQGRNVITRNAEFQVLGDEPAPVEVVAAGTGGGRTSAPADEEPVDLPGLDTASLRTGEVAPGPDEQRAFWDEAAAHALEYSKRLPNFRCTRETRRLTAPVKNPDQFREGDVVISELSYEGGRESARTTEVNGVRTSRDTKAVQGVSSRGEFGVMLRSLFSPEVGAEYRWAGRAIAGGSLCRVFSIAVKAEHSNFVLYHNLRQEVAAYRGRVYVDEETGLVRQLSIEGEALPKDFGLKSPALSLEYGMVRIGEEDYLVPLRSVLQLRQGRTLVRNETIFRDYRKFEAASQIKYQ